MPTSLRLLPSLLLVALACQSEPQTDAELTARLDRVDERLAAMETQVQTVVDWTAAQDAAKAEADAERKAQLEAIAAKRKEREAQREAARAERVGQRRSIFDTLGRDDDDDPLDSSSSREIEGAAEGIQCTEPATAKIECTIDRAFLDLLLANPALLTKQARVVPKSVDGEIDGFKIYGIRRGSLPKLLGMKNGDWIKAINGKSLGGVDEAMAVYVELRSATSLVLEIDRKGLPLALSIEIVE